MIVIVDSTEFTRDYRLEGPAFRALFDSLDKLSLILAVPEVVLREVIANRGREVQALRDKAKALSKKIRSVVGNGAPSFDNIEFETDEQYGDWLRQTLEQVDFMQLPILRIEHSVLIDRATARQKPFNQSGSGYRDTLIWFSVLEVLKNNDVPVCLISGNEKDFGTGPRVFPQLAAEVEAAGVPTDRLILYTSLQGFVDDYVAPRLDAVDSLKATLQSNEEPGFSVRQWIENELVGALEDIGGIEFLSPLPVAHLSTVTARVEKVNRYKVSSVAHLPGGDFLVKGNADVVLALAVGASSRKTARHDDVREYFGVEPGVLVRRVFGVTLNVSFNLVLADDTKELISADVDHFTSKTTPLG